MTSDLNLGTEPEFQLGGPAYRLMQRLGLIRPGSPSLLRRFVAFLLGADGRAILTANEQPLITPALGNNYSVIPNSLQGLCKPMP